MDAVGKYPTIRGQKTPKLHKVFVNRLFWVLFLTKMRSILVDPMRNLLLKGNFFSPNVSMSMEFSTYR